MAKQYQSVRFNRNQDETILASLKAWEEEVFKKAYEQNPHLRSTLRFRGTVPLELLSIRDREELMGKYRTIIDLEGTLQRMAGGRLTAEGEAGARQIMDSPAWIQRRTGKSAYGAVNVYKHDKSVLGYLYNQLNIQTRKPYDKGMAFDHFSIGASTIPTTSSIRSGMSASKQMEAGAKYVVFDIETGGLDFGQIRELSYAKGVAGSGLGAARETHMRSTSFARGMLAVNGRAMSMEDFMKARFGIDYSSMTAGSGEDLVTKMMPFLKDISDARYILGHNISSFDIQQVFVGLSGTSAYKNNVMIDGVGFRDFLDNIHSGLDDKVIDTLAMAKNAPNLRGITTAAELRAMGDSSSFSIANLILQTDLVEQAKAAGIDLESLIDNGRGLHLGSVDTQVTAALAQFIPSLNVTGGTYGSSTFRRGVARSGAILPITKIKDPSQISDELLSHLIRKGEVTSSDHALNKLLEGISGHNAKKRKATSINEILGMIRSGEYDVKFENPVTALEQQAFHTRNLNLISNTNVDMDSRVLAINRFNRLTGQRSRYTGAVKKAFGSMKRTPNPSITQAQFDAFQKSAAASGLPYAGLSFEERKLGTALAQVTSSLAGGSHQRKAALIGSDSLISHFKNYTSLYMNENPNVRLAMPLQLLEEILPARADKRVSFSPFKYKTEAGEAFDVNAVYRFRDSNELEKASVKLSNLLNQDDARIASVLGIDPVADAGVIAEFRKNAPDFISRLNSEETLERGVSVARIGNSDTAEKVYDLITEFRGGIAADDGTIAFSSQIIDRQGSSVRIGAPVIDRFADPKAIAARAEEARVFLDDFIGYVGGGPDSVMGQPRLRNLAANIVSKVTSEEHAGKLLKLTDDLSNLRPKMAKAAGVAGVAALGIFAARKHRQDQQLNEPLQQMPYEVGTNYALNSEIILRMANGATGAKYMDPLATAPLTGNLYDNRIGHSSMAFDKNSALFGGVI